MAYWAVLALAGQERTLLVTALQRQAEDELNREGMRSALRQLLWTDKLGVRLHC